MFAAALNKSLLSFKALFKDTTVFDKYWRLFLKTDVETGTTL